MEQLAKRKLTMTDYETIVGLEIHVELKTVSKMFCGCKNDPFHAPKANVYTCPVCLGMPGALPVPNKKAVEWTVMLGLALGCEIQHVSKFDRKNYFYPDLPKGYQISQYDQPFCIKGSVTTSAGEVGITRVHLEEDTGKLLHKDVDGKKATLIDFNRSGVPLVEIVTEPDIRSGEHAKEFLLKLYQIIRYLGISDADMEKGSMRLEPNISVRNAREKKLPSYKVEVKNINSFNFVRKAIEFETKRQIELLDKGEIPKQETRGWQETKGETLPQRRKETADDYRYFPEPDIPPIRLSREFIEGIAKHMPPMPDDIVKSLMNEHTLSQYQADVLVRTMSAELFSRTVLLPVIRQAGISGSVVANWIINKVKNTEGLTPESLASHILEGVNVVEVDAATVDNAIAAAITANPKAVADYENGKEQAVMFLFGQVLKELKGKGDKQKILAQLKHALASMS